VSKSVGAGNVEGVDDLTLKIIAEVWLDERRRSTWGAMGREFESRRPNQKINGLDIGDVYRPFGFLAPGVHSGSTGERISRKIVGRDSWRRRDTHRGIV
jgi:hypothetical protein